MIVIIDFGSQYNQLIARRVRENHVFCQIEPPGIPLATLKARQPEGIILSGGPSSIYEAGSPKVDPGIFTLGVPVLGICYGMQFMTAALGGSVERAGKREYGFAELRVTAPSGLFKGIGRNTTCWMSHGDSISQTSRGFSRHGLHAEHPLRGCRRPPAQTLRRAVPPGSRPHPAGRGHAQELSLRHLRLQALLEHEILRARSGRRDPRKRRR